MYPHCGLQLDFDPIPAACKVIGRSASTEPWRILESLFAIRVASVSYTHLQPAPAEAAAVLVNEPAKDAPTADANAAAQTEIAAGLPAPPPAS